MGGCGNVTLMNWTDVPLSMTTSVIGSETVIVQPGQFETLSNLHAGPAYNPRTIIVKHLTTELERLVRTQEYIELRCRYLVDTRGRFP